MSQHDPFVEETIILVKTEHLSKINVKHNALKIKLYFQFAHYLHFCYSITLIFFIKCEVNPIFGTNYSAPIRFYIRELKCY